MKASQNFKEEMIQTFHNIWKHASEAERRYVKDMWTMMMKPAQVVSWQPVDKSNEYQLELKQEIVGSHPDIPMGEVILKKNMKIAFSEEKIPGTNHYRQIIHFPDQGVCFRIGIGWLSKKSAVERILIEENRNHEIRCTVEALGRSIDRSADETLAFWKKAQWNC